jgi:hypothetical protein
MWQMPKIQEMAVQNILGHTGDVADWKFLLKFSHKLQITEITDKGVQKLSDALLPIEMIEFGIECPAPLLLRRGYKELVEGSGGISEEDEERLGWETTSKLLRIREQYLQDSITWRRDSNIIVDDEIDKVFSQQLKDAGWVKK